MLVVPWDAIDSALLEELSAHSTYCGLSVGLLPAELHTALTAGADGQRSGRILAYAMGLDIDRLDLGSDVTLFGTDGTREFLGAVEAGAEAALLNSHGNGFDMQVGSQIVCARIGADPVERALPCFAGSGCLRGPGPDVDPSTYFDARKLRAGVLILDSCWSVMPRDGLYTAGYGICEVALRSGATQAVLAPTQVQSTSTARFASILARYLAGQTLGEIALAINGDSLGVSGEPPSWILIGDPARRGATRITVGLTQESAAGWLVEPVKQALSAHRLPHDADRLAVGTADGDSRELHTFVSRGLEGSDRLVTVLRTPRTSTTAPAAPGTLRDRARAAVVAALLLRVASGDGDRGLLEQLDEQAIAVGVETPAVDVATAERLDAAVAAAITSVARATDGDLVPYWRTWMSEAHSELGTGPCGGQIQRTALVDGAVNLGRLVARCLTHASLVDRPGLLDEGRPWPDPCSAPDGQEDLSVQVDCLRFSVHRRADLTRKRRPRCR